MIDEIESVDIEGDRYLLYEDVEKLLLRIHKSLDWMITDMKWRDNQTRGNLEKGSEGGWSPQLKEAVALLESIKRDLEL